MNFEDAKKEIKNNKKLYMNPNTGSVDTLDGWFPFTEKDGLLEVTIIGDDNFFTEVE